MNELTETLTFLIHAIKQFCFGFDKMNETADEYEDGSPARAFYMNAIYQYVAIFYLLDKGSTDFMGGAFYKALKPHGLEGLLKPIEGILQTPIGSTTFGEIVHVFRNKAIVHSNYGDADLGRIYSQANMEDPNIMKQFHELLWDLYIQTKSLAVSLIKSVGLQPEQFGFQVK